MIRSYPHAHARVAAQEARRLVEGAVKRGAVSPRMRMSLRKQIFSRLMTLAGLSAEAWRLYDDLDGRGGRHLT